MRREVPLWRRADRGEGLIAKSKSNSNAPRVQYAALPYRYTEAGAVEVLLVTSRSRRRWILPRGWPIKGLKPAEAAAREAFEEAGVRGAVRSKPIGRFTYEKQLDEDGRSVSCEVTVFPLEVVRQHRIWPEVWQREVRWLAVGDAAAIVDDDGLKPLLQIFAEKMAARRKPARRKAAATA
jgi:8-oxo-dGTP pyrophosphatase MutT (NUDIX family)